MRAAIANGELLYVAAARRSTIRKAGARCSPTSSSTSSQIYATETKFNKADAAKRILDAFAQEMAAPRVPDPGATERTEQIALMPINILMPALSPTMEKGNLAKWLKKEGEKVKPGDVIAEIETDKATMEVEAVDEGTLAKIVVPEGTADVPVNQLIAVLAGEGEDAQGRRPPAPAARRAPKAATPPKRRSARRSRREAPQPRRSARRLRPTAPAAAPLPRPPPTATRRIFSSPLARRLAKEAGIDLARIAGSGPHGRVVARDVAGAKEGKGLKAPGAAPSAARGRAVDRAQRCRTTRCARCSRTAPTRSCRTTTCAASSRSGSPRRRRPFRIST